MKSVAYNQQFSTKSVVYNQQFCWKVLPVDGKSARIGKDKGFTQIADLPDSYIFADDIESPVGAKLPLWMLGFLY